MDFFLCCTYGTYDGCLLRETVGTRCRGTVGLYSYSFQEEIYYVVGVRGDCLVWWCWR